MICDTCERNRHDCGHYGCPVLVLDTCPWYQPEPVLWPWLIAAGILGAAAFSVVWGLL